MNLKLSSRDRIILVIAVCAIVFTAGIVLFVKPRYEVLNSAKANLINVKDELSRVEIRISALDGLVEQLNSNAAEIDLTQQNFYAEAQPYINEKIVTGLLSERAIKIKSITTEYTKAEGIERYRVLPENTVAYDMKINGDIYNELPQEVYDAYNNIQAQTAESVTVGVTRIELKFEAAPGIDEIMKCLDDLAEKAKSLVVTTCSCTTDGGDETVSDNSLSIVMYSIVPMNIERLLEENATV